MKPAREPASSCPKSCASLKNTPEILLVRHSLLALGGRKQTVVRYQLSTFPSSETSRFAPWSLAHKDSAFPWLVDDRAALRSRQIWCLVAHQYMQQHAYACCGTLPGFPRPLPLACHHLQKGTKLELGIRAPGMNTILNQPNRRRVSTDRLNHEDIQTVLSLEGESSPTPAGKTLSRSYTPKPGFGGKGQEGILSAHRL